MTYKQAKKAYLDGLMLVVPLVNSDSNSTVGSDAYVELNTWLDDKRNDAPDLEPQFGKI